MHYIILVVQCKLNKTLDLAYSVDLAANDNTHLCYPRQVGKRTIKQVLLTFNNS